MKKIAVFASGGGSNFGAILNGIDSGVIDAEVVLLIASKPDIGAIKRAEERGIITKVFQKSTYGNLDDMFLEIDGCLSEASVDYIVLAGYLTVLPKSFIARYKNRIINIHPSLIPCYCGDGFYGMRVHRAVVAAGETQSGATVHFVDEGTDTGKIILQRATPIEPTDTPEEVAAKVLKIEHQLIVEAVAKVVGNG